jgi:hypothetical protein
MSKMLVKPKFTLSASTWVSLLACSFCPKMDVPDSLTHPLILCCFWLMVMMHASTLMWYMLSFYMALKNDGLLLSRCLLDCLECFHAQCAHYMAHRHIRCLPDGPWKYLSTSKVLYSCGLSTIKMYTAKCKTTLLNHYAQSHSALYHHCITSTPIRSGAHQQMWWN